jgi:hypothetical protein
VAAGRQPLLERVVVVAVGEGAAQLGHPVGADQRRRREGVLDLALDDGRADAADGAHLLERGGGEVGVMHQREGDRREERIEDRRPPRLELGERRVGVEVGLRDVLAAAVEGGRHQQQGAHVEHRQRVPPAVRRGDAEDRGDVGGGADDAEVGLDAALRVGGGARRVHDQQRVLGGGRVGGGGRRLLGRHLFELADREHPGRRPLGEHHRRRDERQRVPQQRLEVGVLVDRIGGEEGAELGVGADVSQLDRLEAGVDRHHRGADHRPAEQQLDQLRAVRQEDAEAVAAAEPECPQLARAALAGGE